MSPEICVEGRFGGFVPVRCEEPGAYEGHICSDLVPLGVGHGVVVVGWIELSEVAV